MKRVLTISLLCFNFICKSQHSPLVSHYMFNAIALNPAYTGSEDAFSIIGSFRAQWVGFPGAPLTQTLTAHTPLKSSKAAMGLQLHADQIGINRRTGVFASYAYRLRMNQSTLVFGTSAGVHFMRSFYSKLEGNDAGDESIMNDSPLGVLPNMSFGIHYYHEKYFFSISLPFFLTHEFDNNAFRLTNNIRNYNLMMGGGYCFTSRSGKQIKPSILLKYRIESPLQADFNVMMNLNKSLDIGLSYRTSEAIIALFKLNANDQFSIMYSFGLPISKLIQHSYGSHELSLKYTFLYQSNSTSPRFIGF